ncbi:hypothetical protein SAMN05444280_11223 [Tangfeifania diversioriginum]|uniref:Uncharacterized protein n=1 Tax=Tangfeifania diversioriginum TaxID=1168035 RepID=A0A1M6GZD6_9BACT|nr:hypothetical protein [Tangfeifania diversioriginum]SHJ15339.1 hypothetical protein SAMN05444280_11223 [Tangfeifania diversioriginum]
MVKFWHRKYVISASAFFTYVGLRIFNRIRHSSNNVVSFWEFLKNFGTKDYFQFPCIRKNLTLSGPVTLTGYGQQTYCTAWFISLVSGCRATVKNAHFTPLDGFIFVRPDPLPASRQAGIPQRGTFDPASKII